MVKMIPAEGLLTSDRVAAMLAVSKRTLYRMVSRPGFPQPIRFNRKLIRWKAEEVRAWIDAQNGGGRGQGGND